jgi:hypothetical protein
MKSEQQSPTLAVLQLSREFISLLLQVKLIQKGAMVRRENSVKCNSWKQGWLRFRSKARKMQLPWRLSVKLCLPLVQETNGWITSKEVWNLQWIMSWINLVKMVTVSS